MLDVFYVRDLKGEAIPDDDPRWTRLLGDLRELLAGPPDPATVATLIARRRPQVAACPTRVTPGRRHRDPAPRRLDAGDDRRGRSRAIASACCYAITQTLADLGLDISLAKVSTEGEKVADVFYVTRGGERITDEAERAALRRAPARRRRGAGLTGS